jgi:DNA-binding MarR family transcriptional regulator
MLNRQVETVLRHYPQIYLACHLAHRRAATSPSGLSERDSAVLGHLSEHEAMTAGVLARHLGVRPSSLSAIVKKLEQRALIERRAHARDRRRLELWLTPKGSQAMRASSVLDARRVERMLARLTADERREAMRGLALLARAARELSVREKKTAWSGGD